jgi:endonuclease/exonuclease/phosphatase family metal-dependent hydrolase
VVDVNGSRLYLVNAHLAQVGLRRFLRTLDPGIIRSQSQSREVQIAQLREAIREAGLPTVMACDCNVTDLTGEYAGLADGMLDAHKEKGWGLGHTFLVLQAYWSRSPASLPFQRIDYLFCTPDIRVVDVQVISGYTGSDHRPLWARFDLVP